MRISLEQFIAVKPVLMFSCNFSKKIQKHPGTLKIKTVIPSALGTKKIKVLVSNSPIVQKG